MATLEKPPQAVDNCRCLLEGSAKNLADRLYGPHGPPWGTSFAELERTALQLGRALRNHFLHLVLSRQATAAASTPSPCPSCARPTVAADPEPRLVQSRAGEAEWLEPQRYCPKCRKAFFPQSRSLGLDLGDYSAAVLDLICYAGANQPSFREASLNLHKIGDLCVHEKQVERLSKRIGAERLAERAADVARYQALPLLERCTSKPDGVSAPGKEQVAVIMADAGMLQLRAAAPTAAESAAEKAAAATEEAAAEEAAAEEAAAEEAAVSLDQASPKEEDAADAEDDPDQDKPPSGRHWREDKVGLVLTMRSEVHASDPCPQVPATFLDPRRVGKIVRGLKKAAAPKQNEPSPRDEAAEDEAEASADAEPPVYDGPKLEQRRVVASRQSWPLFGPLLAMTAWMAGFAPASRKAFVADGARAIWRLWQSRFSSYVPILDFIHALSYVHAAAQAVAAEAANAWCLYQEWITLVWRGDVGAVILRLEQWQAEHGRPEKGETASSPRQVVQKSLTYFRNHRDKMKYADYRQAGLPIVSSLVESMVKQISRRVKGTEKFWGEAGAEAILQLRADYLSDGDVMADFWQRRQAAATGQRRYRSAA